MKKVIIVGASSGIGRELAILYAKKNCLVGITGRRKDLLDELRDEYPDQIIPLSFDNTKDDVEYHLQLLISKLKGLDLLVLSSGHGEINTSLDWKIEQGTLELNVTAWTQIADFTFNFFKQQNHGQFVAITSIASIRGEGRAPAYNASKSYQANYLQGLRKMAVHKKLKVHITDIQPGFVKTDMAKGKGRFWESPADKAARQMFSAIENKKHKAYITKRWWLAAQVLKTIPGWIYNRI
ncbi:MAG: SDR family NAD(P)-dependent oxidoreductase [Chitinophagaceae bacterium]|nr:SDR family NAD(P)-dependent oxidoreductase [Chitinophagaceae bacterium]